MHCNGERTNKKHEHNERAIRLVSVQDYATKTVCIHVLFVYAKTDDVRNDT